MSGDTTGTSSLMIKGNLTRKEAEELVGFERGKANR
jgi:hypothetical protein